MKKDKNVETYIASLPDESKKHILQIISEIEKKLSSAELAFSYGIIGCKIEGKYSFYFAGYKDHIAFYPIFAADHPLYKDLEPYISGRATLRFDVKKGAKVPMPLIRRFITFKIKESKLRNKLSKK